MFTIISSNQLENYQIKYENCLLNLKMVGYYKKRNNLYRKLKSQMGLIYHGLP